MYRPNLVNFENIINGVNTSGSVFKIKEIVFFDAFIQILSLKRMKIIVFRGDLIDVVAKKEALVRNEQGEVCS